MIMGLLFWVCTVVYGLCVVGGGFSFVLLCWLFLTRRGRATAENVLSVPEYRCLDCKNRDGCFVIGGPAYPCIDFQSDKKSEDKPA